MKSTVMDPQVVRRLSSTKNFRVSFSYTLSLSFGSSRAKPREGPAQPPCMRATRRAESILFCSMYSLSFTTAKSVTLKSDMLPPISVGQALDLKDARATQRFTRPPARYNEARLVRKLEELGIGRPSTYAPTISTIQNRNYAVKESRDGVLRKYAEFILFGASEAEGSDA